MSKLGQEPAFPVEIANDKFHIFEIGINTRTLLAGMFIQGLLSNHGRYWQTLTENDPSQNLGGLLPEEAAVLSLQYADALLKKERE